MTSEPIPVGPFLMSDPRWRWAAIGFVVDGAFWPFKVEIRYKSTPCHHDAPVDWDDDEPGIVYVDPCDCWDGLKVVSPDQLPLGGLSTTMLREIRLLEAPRAWLKQRAADYAAENVAQMVPVGPNGKRRPSADRLTATMDAIAASTALPNVPPPGPGRKPIPDEIHLKRLAILHNTYSSGGKQSTAVKKAGIRDGAMRGSLDWGRERGYWQVVPRGRRGDLTPDGRDAVAAAGFEVAP